MASGHFEDAKASFQKLVAIEPRIAEVHATLAVIDFKLRAYDEAVREIHTAQKLKPGLPKLDSLLGMSLAEQGQFKEALPGLEKGFKQTADPEVRRMCGLQLLRAYTGLSRDPDAVETALALNKSFPNDPEVLYHTGRVFGNYTYVVMEKLHDKAPNSIWMLQAQGEALESQKDYDGAITAFNHVLVMDPRRPAIHYRLGRVYLKRFNDTHKSEDRDSAIKEFAAEMEIDPGSGNAAYELATIQSDAGNFEEARKNYELVIQRFPDFEDALVGLGGVYLQSDKPDLAVPPLKRATTLRPDDRVAWYRLALAERGVGNKDATQTAMARYRELRNAENVAEIHSPNASDITPQQEGPGTEP